MRRGHGKTCVIKRYTDTLVAFMPWILFDDIMLRSVFIRILQMRGSIISVGQETLTVESLFDYHLSKLTHQSLSFCLLGPCTYFMS